MIHSVMILETGCFKKLRRDLKIFSEKLIRFAAWGGDEFIILLARLTRPEDNIADIIQKMLTLLINLLP